VTPAVFQGEIDAMSFLRAIAAGRRGTAVGVLCVVIFLGSAASSTARAGLTAKSAVAFVNVNVVSMDPADKTIQKRMTVVVEDGVITAIGPARRTEVPAGAEVVNGKGKYLVPGLNDMHFHIRGIRGLPEDFEPADVYTILLAYGVTGIFDPWGFKEAFAWQRDVDRGKVEGPRFRFSSPGIDEEDYPNPDAIAADIRKWAKKGYQWIKSHDLNTEEAFERVFAAAASAGVPVIGHALRPGFPITTTLAQMPLMIAHIEEILATTPHTPENYREEFAGPTMAVAAARTWVTTTTDTYEVIAATVDDALFAQLPTSPGMEYLPPSVAAGWTTQNPYREPTFPQDRDYWLYELSVKQNIVKQLKANGHADRLLLGTDSGGPAFVIPGESVHDEMRLLKQAGLTTLEVIQTATVNPAVFFAEADIAGTVSVGKRADLILVKKNPTKKIGNLRKLAGTMVRGEWLSEATLQERLAELEQRWTRRPETGPDGAADGNEK
jgi:imidazolonepropionase-like amidohydrolase